MASRPYAERSEQERERGRQRKAERYADPVERAKILDSQFLWRYGITRAQRDEMLATQGGSCAACGSPEPGDHRGWHTDHDHSCCPGIRSCGQCVRGVLCGPCNLALGHVKDNPERLRRMADYLDLAGLTGGGAPNLQANVSRRMPA